MHSNIRNFIDNIYVWNISASAMREKKRSKKMVNPENDSPGTCKKLQLSSLSRLSGKKGQRNQIDGGVSLDSVVCILNTKFTCRVYCVLCCCGVNFDCLFMFHISVWF